MDHPGAPAGFTAEIIFDLRQAKEQDRRNTRVPGRLDLLRHQVHGPAVYAWHSGDGFFNIFPGHDKERIDKIVRSQMRFPDQTAQGFPAAQPAGTIR